MLARSCLLSPRLTRCLGDHALSFHYHKVLFTHVLLSFKRLATS